jgi:transcriptional regulator with XRE-family HTH domain
MRVCNGVQFAYVSGERFVEWLEGELAARNWRPADLARAANISTGALSSVLTGSRNVGVDMANAIALGLGLPPDLVFRRAGLLPPQPGPERDPTLQELIEIMRNLSPDERREVVDYALFRYRRRPNGEK